jgi:hypothetical protein
MNETQKETAATGTCASFVDTLRGLGATWAAHGLKIGKLALETSAEAIGKTAHALDELAVQIEKKAAPKAEEPKAEEPKTEQVEAPAA